MPEFGRVFDAGLLSTPPLTSTASGRAAAMASATFPGVRPRNDDGSALCADLDGLRPDPALFGSPDCAAAALWAPGAPSSTAETRGLTGGNERRGAAGAEDGNQACSKGRLRRAIARRPAGKPRRRRRGSRLKRPRTPPPLKRSLNDAAQRRHLKRRGAGWIWRTPVPARAPSSTLSLTSSSRVTPQILTFMKEGRARPRRDRPAS